MAGIFGLAGKEANPDDLYLGTFYLQHRAPDYCGLGGLGGNEWLLENRKGLIKGNFSGEELSKVAGRNSIGCVASDRQPVAEISNDNALLLGFDGNIINNHELVRKLAASGAVKDEKEVSDAVVASKIISSERNFESGIEKLVGLMQGDFAIVALSKQGLYAARGWGRKPLIVGRKDGSYAVASESNAFCIPQFEIVRDVMPGEIVRITPEGIETIKMLDLKPVKFGTFEWIYTAYPSSVIDGREVAGVRRELGKYLAKRFPVDADFVSPVPNSGRWHAIGYSHESGIPYVEAFIRWDYSDRSFTPSTQEARAETAKTKLIPVEGVIRGKRIVIVDDSIVRGNQMLNRVKELKRLGAKEVHARIACPPLMNACNYGKTTRKDDECIARRMPIEEIRKKLELDSLGYATVEDLEWAIGMPREKLCLECWGF
jgi:amidophosphoribosyltransferase